MTKTIWLLGILFFLTVHPDCHAQQNSDTMKQTTNNPLLCDPETGLCELPGQSSQQEGQTLSPNQKPVRIIYYTDPICSACWGIEPQLRKLQLEYGVYFEIEYRMGGLLPDWSYNSGGISKPSDVAHHWEEVSQHYDMPIDGGVWLEDPLHSSYPPSIAFKAVEMQAPEKTTAFMRLIREQLFIEKKNIARQEVINQVASELQLDTVKLEQAMEQEAKVLFQEDLAQARQLGVRGFPSLFVIGKDQEPQIIYGVRPYKTFEEAILSAYPGAEKLPYDKSWQGLFKAFSSLTTREFAELSDMPRVKAEELLQQLAEEKRIEKTSIKNGSIWRLSKKN